MPRTGRGGRMQLPPSSAGPDPGLVAEASAERGLAAAAKQQQLASGAIIDQRRSGAGRRRTGRVKPDPAGVLADPSITQYGRGALPAEQHELAQSRVVGEGGVLTAS